MTLYLKYRPQTIGELDSTSAREGLKKIIASGKIPHALLFSGPKGIGKTSAARILAKAINCEKPGKSGEPCNRCMQCEAVTKGNSLDVIEMDAASNRGIDDIRSLREAVKLSPVSAKTKVYVVDEAHMLTLEAANAFLKTLEEPPSHVVFILATTNPEKLIPTVRSRLTNIVFTKASLPEIKRLLSRVDKGVKWKVDGLELHVGELVPDVSFRDAIKIIEQMMVGETELSQEKARSFVTQNKTITAKQYIEIIAKKDIKAIIEELEAMINKGGSVRELIDGMIASLHESLLAKLGVGKTDAFDYLIRNESVSLIEVLMVAQKKYSDTPLPQLSLEMELIAWKQKTGQDKPVVSVVKNTKPRDKVTNGHSEDVVANGNVDLKFESDVWQKVLSQVRQKNVSVEALLRSSKPLDFDGKNLRLGVYYKFHKERLEADVYRKTLEDILTSVVGSPVRVVCILTDQPKKKVIGGIKKTGNALTENTDIDIMEAAKEIFGS